MSKKTKKQLTKNKPSKKQVKIDPLAYEKQYLTNVINLLQRCANECSSGDLGPYFQSKADLNRERLKALK